MRIAAAIIDLFHLLPPAPDKKILVDMIRITRQLEDNLPLTNCYGGFGTNASSPYRRPLIKFLSKNDGSVPYFLETLHDKGLAQMFQSILKQDHVRVVALIILWSIKVDVFWVS